MYWGLIMCERIAQFKVNADNSRKFSFSAGTDRGRWHPGSARHKRRPGSSLPSLLMGIAMTAFLATNVSAQSPASADQRADALLSQMTLEEKIGQMTQVDMNALKDKADIQKYRLWLHAQRRRL